MAVRCGDCGQVTPLRPDETLSHFCTTVQRIKTVRSDGTRVDPDEMDPRNLPFAWKRSRPDAVRGPAA